MIGVSKTGWVLVHPTKGVKWDSLSYREDRPRGLVVSFTAWRWQRVILSLDDGDHHD